MSFGGGAPGGETRYWWNPTMEGHWAGNPSDPNSGALNQAFRLNQRPYQHYTGQRIAGLDPRHNQAAGGVDHFVGSGGSPTTIAAGGQAYNTLTNHYLTGAGANPHATAANQYAGVNSPHFRNVMQLGLQDIGNAYRDTVLPGVNSEAIRAGVFGGGDHNRAVERSEGQLAEQMQRYAAGMQNDQYNRSAGLEDNRLGRATGAYEGERQRQMGAIGAGQNEQNLFFDRIRNLMGMGDMYRSFNQDHLNLNFGDWQEEQNHPYRMLDWYTGMLSRAQGGMSPNMSWTSTGHSASPFSTLLGGAMLGNSLFGGR